MSRNRVKFLATSIVVVPIVAPRCVYGLSMLAFEHADTAETLYRRLCRGEELSIGEFTLRPFEKEEPATLLVEKTPALYQKSDVEWALTLQQS